MQVESKQQSPLGFTEKPYYLLAISSFYLLAAANEYWVINWFKMFGVSLSLYFAILQNSSWPLQLAIYWRECKSLPEKRVITHEIYRSYIILGCLAAFINLTRMFSLATLPPVLTVICSNTEIIFEVGMSRFILKQSASKYQCTAVCLVLVGVFVALWDPVSGTLGGGQKNSSGSGHISQDLLLLAVCVSIMSRFASSLNTILAEKFLGKNAKSKIGIKECTLVNSIVPFFVLPFGLLATKEYQLWPDQLYHTGSVRNTVIIALLSFALCESKHLDRFCKYAIVENTSTIFFAGVDSAMKMVAGIMSFVFFPSTTPSAVMPTTIGFLFIAAAVVLLYLDKRRNGLVTRNVSDEETGERDDTGVALNLILDHEAGAEGPDSLNPLVIDHTRTSIAIMFRPTSQSGYMRVQSSDAMDGDTSGNSAATSKSTETTSVGNAVA